MVPKGVAGQKAHMEGAPNSGPDEAGKAVTG
jgi:hypothetical protein